MTWHGKRMPDFIKASTEERLQQALKNISLTTGQKLEVMTIYVRGGNIVAWYFLEAGDMPKVQNLKPEESKPVRKKKAKKKAK